MLFDYVCVTTQQYFHTKSQKIQQFLKSHPLTRLFKSMQLTLILSTLFQSILYGVLCYNNMHNYTLFLAFIFNTVLLLRIYVGFGLKYTMSRLIRGQILPMYLYLLWLVLYPQDEHLYRLPLLLSCIGKVYLLFTTPEGLWIDAVENLIMLQSHTELFIVFYHLLKTSIGGGNFFGKEAVLQFVLLVLIMKLKFEIHYGTRRSYESIHFALDRCAKNLRIRPFYHFLQRLASNLAGDWHHSKVISY